MASDLREHKYVGLSAHNIIHDSANQELWDKPTISHKIVLIRKYVHSCYAYATVLIHHVGFLPTYIVRLLYINFHLAATVCGIM